LAAILKRKGAIGSSSLTPLWLPKYGPTLSMTLTLRVPFCYNLFDPDHPFLTETFLFATIKKKSSWPYHKILKINFQNNPCCFLNFASFSTSCNKATPSVIFAFNKSSLTWMNNFIHYRHNLAGQIFCKNLEQHL
jgi:hypothetical protein